MKGTQSSASPRKPSTGFTREQLFEGYKTLKAKGVNRFGLHTMVASNERNAEFFVETAEMLFELATALHNELGIGNWSLSTLVAVELESHIDPRRAPVDLARVGEGVRQKYVEMVEGTPIHPLKVLMENGRMITGPSGYLITKAIHHKNIYKEYVGVDACMANLMRPGMYGAYHHITVLGKEDAPHDTVCDVVGSLCENNDKFAIDRALPKIETGDTLVIHSAGAHGHSMGFQYNGKLRSAEVLLREDGSFELIRRAETVEDYFATLQL